MKPDRTEPVCDESYLAWIAELVRQNMLEALDREMKEMTAPAKAVVRDGELYFVVYCTPTPQGSLKAFVRNGRAALTSDNRKLKPYRQEVAQTALFEVRRLGVQGPMFGKHVPIAVTVNFFFLRPPSIPKKRTEHVVKPDVDKLLRATFDAITGIVFCDDAQIVLVAAGKSYAETERVEITVCAVK